jgi:hypothetical protein
VPTACTARSRTDMPAPAFSIVRKVGIAADAVRELSDGQ